MMEQPQNQFWGLLAKKLSKEATPEELQELHSLLLNNPELQHRAEILTEMWQQQLDPHTAGTEAAYIRYMMKYKDELFPEDPQALVSDKIALKETTVTSAKKRLTIFSFIAVILLVSGAVYFFTQKEKTGSSAVQPNSSIVTKNGNRSKILLPDGSQVWLNAGSNLDYNNADFNKNLREVSLNGEAYFDVVKNSAKPFIIHTRKMDIKVIGTSFNVRSYNDERVAEASLIRGSIEVILKERNNEKMILKPNEKISISVNDSDQVISKPGKVTAAKRDLQKIPQVIVADLTPNPTDNIIPEIAWTQNRIYFKEESLENIAPIIERWYGKKVVIRNESLKKMAYTCNLENVTLENLLAYLKLSNPFNFRFEKDTVIIF